jgi:hypothetical protein
MQAQALIELVDVIDVDAVRELPDPFKQRVLQLV